MNLVHIGAKETVNTNSVFHSVELAHSSLEIGTRNLLNMIFIKHDEMMRI